jgi:hypothetical protein
MEVVAGANQSREADSLDAGAQPCDESTLVVDFLHPGPMILANGWPHQGGE